MSVGVETRVRSQQEQWFVSYSYKDEESLKLLKDALPRNVVPVIFPPIDIPVTDFVSEPILKTIEACDSLVFFDTPDSLASFWVPFEIEHAKRHNRRVYKFSPLQRNITEDQSPPIELPVYVSFAAVDEARVREVVLWAKHRRNFDLWYQEQTGPLNEIFDRTNIELERSMRAGGYLVAFVSAWSATRGNLRNEVIKAREISADHVLIAWLDDPADLSIPGVVVPKDKQIFLRPTLVQDPDPERRLPNSRNLRNLEAILTGKILPVRARDIDDFIVRIYWLRWSGQVHDKHRTGHDGEHGDAAEH
jgi:hypothetical protein